MSRFRMCYRVHIRRSEYLRRRMKVRQNHRCNPESVAETNQWDTRLVVALKFCRSARYSVRGVGCIGGVTAPA